jgi:hypothetical protein
MFHRTTERPQLPPTALTRDHAAMSRFWRS